MPNQANATPSPDDDIDNVPMIGTFLRRRLIHTTIVSKQEWNGDRSDWESWPIGRPGPFVSESVTLDLLRYFVALRKTLPELLGEAPPFHVAEFSADGQGWAISLAESFDNIVLTFVPRAILRPCNRIPVSRTIEPRGV
jgi:hypothetical protein